ncbi:MAG: glycosyl transferase, partial [Candidatus Ranarchaeia archaeon]
ADSNLSAEKKEVAKRIFYTGLPWAHVYRSLRAKAFVILGLNHYRKACPTDERLIINTKALADELLDGYHRESSEDWQWFEPCLTYGNGRLSQAMFAAYDSTNNKEYLKVAKESLDFIMGVQTIDGIFTPIGNKGWYRRGGKRALYDQQPIEAYCMTDTVLTAFHVTKDERYRLAAHMIFEWFLGRNIQDVKVYNHETGGCYDAVTPRGVNLNQGAEATLSYLLARLRIGSSR